MCGIAPFRPDIYTDDDFVAADISGFQHVQSDNEEVMPLPGEVEGPTIREATSE